MKIALFLNFALLTLLFFSCAEKNEGNENEKVVDTTQEAIGTNESVPYSPNHDSDMKDDSVQVKLKIEKLDQLNYNLVLDLKLFGKTWIVSPLAYDYPYGHLRIDLELKNHLTKVDSLLENPKSNEFYDESYEGSYPLIKEKVTLTQKLKIKNKADFKVYGLVFFVLEPICTPYELTFILNHQNGELSLEQTDFHDILNRAVPNYNQAKP